MKFPIMVVFLILFGCGSKSNECTKIKDKAANQLIIDYHKAISEKNYQELHNLSTENYVLYEAGAIWNNDSLINLVKSKPQVERKFTLKNMSIETDCNGAFVNYLNHCIQTINDTTKVNYYWLESAYMRIVDKKLKLDFIHSTDAK